MKKCFGHAFFFMMALALVLIFAIILIERHTLPNMTPEMVLRAYEYGDDRKKEVPPRYFHYDGCTWFVDSLLDSDFKEACLEHDIMYWYGGSAKERQEADAALRSAIAASGFSGYILQWPMYLGVRVFGDSPMTHIVDANWGFGWNE